MMIRTATFDDIAALGHLTSREGHVKDNSYFPACLDRQQSGERDIFLVFDGDDLAGYCQYQRRPKYQPFRSMGVPEVQDIYIGPDFRRRGLATRLINRCVEQARGEGKDLLGIGVGLHSGYGKAQKLYVKTGFEPDGGGIVYDRETVIPGHSYKVDDELCLMMIKKLD